jgi:UDP-N-acetylglucosamine--N-acetylmuramyl-(pentapeptide) pyrophosphoryl-undecaprenol N-acetylglucosamine transferase
MEKKLVERHGLPFEAVLSGKLRRYFSFKNLVDFFKLPIGVFQAFWKIIRLKPDVVFSKGGFVSLPVVVAAWILRKPIVIHESDATPGLTTKLCARLAKKILLAYPSAEEELTKYKKKIEVVGNPIRQEIINGDPEIAKRITGFKGDRPVLLVMGGSNGSAQLNQIVKEEKGRLMEEFDVVHITGAIHSEPKSEEHYWSAGFIHDEMSAIYALATHVMSRAGANTLAELEALQMPSLIYPLGLHQSRGDQIINANFTANKYDFINLADEEKAAHTQLLLLPKRVRKKAESHVARHIAGLLINIETNAKV